MFYRTSLGDIYWGKQNQEKTKITIYTWNAGNWQYYGTYSTQDMQQATKNKQIKKLNKNETNEILAKQLTNRVKMIHRVKMIQNELQNDTTQKTK